MPLQQSIERVSHDIERGDLGKARDRLEGMLRSYPESLEIRRMLGDVYWTLQYPERAGLHWFLIEGASPEMLAAREAFTRRYGDDPILMLHAIRFRGGLEAIRGTYAEEALQKLGRRAHLGETRLERMTRHPQPGEPTDHAETFFERHILKIIGFILLAVLGLAAVGLGSLIDFVLGLF